jgi:hypothetical protein
MIGTSIVENLNKSLIKNLELLYNYKKKNILLKNKFTLNEVKDKEFKKFISLLGYRRNSNVYSLKDSIINFLNKLKI